MSAWLWLALAILSTACGQLVFKRASVARSRPHTAVALCLFGVATLAAFMALQTLSLATVYVSTALAQLIVVLASMLLFGERYDSRQWTGLGLILAGLLVFNIHAIR